MKHLIQFALVVSAFWVAMGFTACSDNDSGQEAGIPAQPGGEGGVGNSNNEGDTIMIRDITIIVNGMSFHATLEDNDAAHTFASMLPLTLDMDEMNGNEKYCYLDSSLSTGSYRPGTIRSGDLMLYGSSCIVLFYETFSSSYSYTRLGRIDNPEGLASAVGGGNVTVRFEVQ